MANPRRIREYFARYRGHFAAGIVFLILTQGFALVVPQLLRIATDHIVAGNFGGVHDAAYILAAVAIGGASVRICSRILLFNSGRKVEHDIRNDLFGHLTSLPPSFYGAMPTGQIMSRAVSDLTQVRLLLGPGLLNLTNTALVYIVVIPLLIATDPILALLSLSTLPALVLAGRWMGKKMYQLTRVGQERLGNLSNKVQENLGGTMTVRVFSREEAETKSFAKLNQSYYEANVELAKLRGQLFPMMGLFGAVGAVVLLYFGGQRIMAGTMTIGEFVQFNGYLAALTWPTVALGWMISLWQRGLAAMDRINDIFATEPAIKDGGEQPPTGAGRLALADLTFTYPKANTPALNNITTAFEPGEKVVIVGRTGSGKTTLLRAIARLIDVPENAVFLDGTDVTKLSLDAVRSMLSYAPQDAFLFSRTLFENIAYGRPDAGEDTVQLAVKRAGLAIDIAGFPDGLDTLVGERGITLSGGQRQRSTLARALIIDAPVLMLDDTLSAVDTETETTILEELAKTEGRTTIIVTHRLACAATADRILVMDEGRIAEQGSEDELLALGGIYAQMHRRQRLKQSMESAA